MEDWRNLTQDDLNYNNWRWISASDLDNYKYLNKEKQEEDPLYKSANDQAINKGIVRFLIGPKGLVSESEVKKYQNSNKNNQIQSLPNFNIIKTPKGIKVTSGEDFRDRFARLMEAPTAEQLRQKGILSYQQTLPDNSDAIWNRSHDKHEIDVRKGDARARALTPGFWTFTSPALLGVAAILGFESVSAMSAFAAAYPKAFTSILGSTLGGESVDVLSNLMTGKSWGDNMNDTFGNGDKSSDTERFLWGMTNIGYGINPLSRFSKVPLTLSQQAFNRIPVESAIDKTLRTHVIPTIAKWPVTKRGVETFMRTGLERPNIEGYKANIEALNQSKDGRKQLRDVARYIITGYRKGHNGRSYRSLHPKGLEYQGFDITPREPNDRVKDMVDAYLYDAIIDPSLLELKGRGSDFGIHSDYIKQFYGDIADNIPVYMGKTGFGKPVNVPTLKNEKGISISSAEQTMEDPIMTLNGADYVDTGGHLVARDRARNYEQIQDIWKFRAKEYNDRYKDFQASPDLKKRIASLAMELVDRSGTPIITRTPVYEAVYEPGFELPAPKVPKNKATLSNNSIIDMSIDPDIEPEPSNSIDDLFFGKSMKKYF